MIKTIIIKIKKEIMNYFFFPLPLSWHSGHFDEARPPIPTNKNNTVHQLRFQKAI
tara:strand:- start:9567 stop:9731 length:165 start_codon:yes stop_codon:yes gene_type:complete